MRKTVIITLVLSVCCGVVYGQTPSESIKFEETVYNFGTIEEKNGKVSHTFVFQNKGKAPVAINDIYSACGCIGKVHSKEPVKPGAKGKVTVTFDPAYKSGFFSKEVVVHSNNGQNYNRIWVEGSIIPAEHPVEEDYPYNLGDGLHLRLKVMAFGYVKPGETRQMELHYANAANKEMILSFAVKDNKTGLTFINPGKIAAKARGVIKFSYTRPSVSRGDVVFTLYPYVNRKKLADTVEIKILGEAMPGQRQNSKAKAPFF